MMQSKFISWMYVLLFNLRITAYLLASFFLTGADPAIFEKGGPNASTRENVL